MAWKTSFRKYHEIKIGGSGSICEFLNKYYKLLRINKLKIFKRIVNNSQYALVSIF